MHGCLPYLRINATGVVLSRVSLASESASQKQGSLTCQIIRKVFTAMHIKVSIDIAE